MDFMWLRDLCSNTRPLDSALPVTSRVKPMLNVAQHDGPHVSGCCCGRRPRCRKGLVERHRVQRFRALRRTRWEPHGCGEVQDTGRCALRARRADKDSLDSSYKHPWPDQENGLKTSRCRSGFDPPKTRGPALPQGFWWSCSRTRPKSPALPQGLWWSCMVVLKNTTPEPQLAPRIGGTKGPRSTNCFQSQSPWVPHACL